MAKMQKDKVEAIKVTLRPKQINKIMDLANDKFDDNFSLALRVVIDSHEKLPPKFEFVMVNEYGVSLYRQRKE